MPAQMARTMLGSALVAITLTLLCHLLVLTLSQGEPIAGPVALLSQGRWGDLHSLGLCSFALAHLLLALAMTGRDHGHLWPWAQGTLILCALAIAGTAWQLASAPPQEITSQANLLWLVASLAGTATGLMAPGLARLGRVIAQINFVVLVLWVLLIPAWWWMGPALTGAYERMVGGLYLGWLSAVTVAEFRRST
ncbi:MAG: hypothetical protein AAGI15_14530 [Pseudomonadota bacterium]